MKTSFKNDMKQLAQKYRAESLVFLFSTLLFASLALWAFSTGILNPVEGQVGAYLGYDNYSRFVDRGGILDLSHPLINPFYIFNQFIAVRLLGTSAALLLAVLLMCFSVVGCITAVFYYLRRITDLPLGRSILLTALLASSFTLLCLSFTIETYPPSLFILTLSVVVLSYDYKKRAQFSTRSIWLFAFLSGAITLSNVAKPAILLLFGKGKIKSRFLRAASLTIAFVSLLLLVALAFTWRANKVGTPHNAPLPVLKGALSNYRTPAEHWMSEYFGQAFLVSDLALREANQELTLRPAPYPQWYWHLPQYLLAILVLASLFFNRRNPLIWILASYLAIDIFVNVICHYGMDEAIIFGGHWVFLIPLFLAQLYPKLKQHYARALDVLLISLVAWQLYSNLPLVVGKLLANTL